MRSRALRLSKELHNRNIERGKVAENLDFNRRRRHVKAVATIESQGHVRLVQQLFRQKVQKGTAGLGSKLEGIPVRSRLALGPGRQHLLDTRGRLGNLLELVVDLFPDSGDTEKGSGSHILQSGPERALEGIGLGKVDLATRPHGHVHVEHLCGNVREGQVGDHDIGVIHTLFAGAFEHRFDRPGDVVVGDHDGFGRARGSGRVNQGTGLTGLPRRAAVLEFGIRDILTEFEKVVKGVDGDRDLAGDIGRELFRSVHDQSLERRQLHPVELLELLDAITDNDLSLAVFTNVLTGFRIVGGVDSSTDSTRRHGSEVGKEPLCVKET